jgi:hypothetical protein
MATIHLIGGEKGGVGKSVVARVVAQYLIDKPLPFVGFDAERSNGALTRFYAGYASQVALDTYESLDGIVEAAVEEPDRRILVDLAARSHEPLTRWIDDSGLLETAGELGVSLRYWHVLDSGKDGVVLLEKLLDRFGDRLRYVLVQNEVRGDDFALLEHSGQKQRALHLGASVISLRRLHDAAMRKIDAHDASFWAACHNDQKDVHGLGLMDRQRVRMWLRHAYGQLDAVEV